jgi:hypothetical protein
MKNTEVVLGGLTIILCLSGCSSRVVEFDLTPGGSSLGQPAVLEYKYTPTTLSGIELVEVDGRRVDTGYKKEFRNNQFKLVPGAHRVRFQGEDGWSVRPEVVEFEAKPGRRYKTGFERVNFRSTDGAATTLYFNFVSPVVFEERDGKPVKVAAGASAPFKTGLDAEKNFLLYEDSTLSKEQTARLYISGRGGRVFIMRISGQAGETRVEFQRSKFDLSQYYGALPGSWPEPWQLRLLPGEYRFDLTVLTVIDEARGPVTGAVKALTLNAEAGHTYRLNGNLKNSITTSSTAVTLFLESWNPVFEDVTGKGFVDQ